MLICLAGLAGSSGHDECGGVWLVWQLGLATDYNIVIFLDTLSIINVKHHMLVVFFTELYPFMPF